MQVCSVSFHNHPSNQLFSVNIIEVTITTMVLKVQTIYRLIMLVFCIIVGRYQLQVVTKNKFSKETFKHRIYFSMLYTASNFLQSIANQQLCSSIVQLQTKQNYLGSFCSLPPPSYQPPSFVALSWPLLISDGPGKFFVTGKPMYRSSYYMSCLGFWFPPMSGYPLKIIKSLTDPPVSTFFF